MKKQNGISILSLLITIIVLLILAAVAISLLVGEATESSREPATTTPMNQIENDETDEELEDETDENS